jgi:hypothetical protein
MPADPSRRPCHRPRPHTKGVLLRLRPPEVPWPGSVAGVARLMGGTAIPLREQDAQNGPGEYRCRKFGRIIVRADAKAGPKELEPGCKERR